MEQLAHEIDPSSLFRKTTGTVTSTPKSPKKREPKEPKIRSARGGGWQIKAEWYGQGMTIRCKEPFDGSIWECDHDALADAVNASLKAKGKSLLGEPGPSVKQYGASGGLRSPGLWRRIDQA